MLPWKSYIIALAVGLLVGIERENSKADQKALGVRTFLLLSFLGALAGDLENSGMAVLLCAFSLLLIFTSYVIQIFSKTEKIQLGLTTEFAAGIVFIIGYMSHHHPILAATMGPVVALILFSKVSLHQFTRKIVPLELRAAITILLIAAVVIDLAPDTAIDPWGLFNPRKFGYLILALAALEFSSYILYKMIGEKKGSLVVGFLGGLVSSTAVLISSARQNLKAPESWRIFLCTILIAQMASFVELMVIVLLVSQTLFMKVMPPIAISLVFCVVCLFLIWKKQIPQNVELTLKSPLDWKGVFRLSFIFGLLFVMVSAVELWIGHDALLTASFLAGLFELQGISLANATLFTQKQLSIELASRCIFLAVVASLISKIAVSWFFGRNKFSSFLTFIFLPMILIVWWIGGMN